MYEVQVWEVDRIGALATILIGRIGYSSETSIHKVYLKKAIEVLSYTIIHMVEKN